MATTIRMNEDGLRAVRDARRDETPAGMRRFVRAFQKDAAERAIPPGVELPDPVAEAKAELESFCASGLRLADEMDGAEQTRQAAAVDDERNAAAALVAGKAAPAKLEQDKAEEGIRKAQARLRAVRTLIIEAHGRLMQAERECWAEWDRKLGEDARQAHDALNERLQEVLTAYQGAVAAYSARSLLAREMGARFPDLRSAMDNDKRGPFNYYGATHAGGRPLKRVTFPDPRGAKRPPIVLELAAALPAVIDACAAEPNDPAAAYVVPTDPEYAKALGEPLDLSEPWVRAAVARRQGSSRCAVCGLPGANTVVEDGPELVLAHERCANRPETAKEKRRREREEKHANWRRSGFPPSPDESMRALDD